MLKQSPQRSAILFFLGTLLWSACHTSSEKGGSASIQPHPTLSPVEVVGIQIDALGKNDDPYENAGIETAFRFASPANKVNTGPLGRFIQLAHSPAYFPLIDHKGAEYGELLSQAGEAVQPVIITSQTGERIGYTFFLSKQTGGRFDSCWMTDGVIRFNVSPKSPPPLQTI